MNYYLVQTKYFLVFIIIFSSMLSALPSIQRAFDRISYIYTQSTLKRIQAELFFVSDFTNSCYNGNIGMIVRELYNYSDGKMVCRTNSPENSQIVVCSELEVGRYRCIDAAGLTCEFPYAPASGYSCKELI